MDVPSPRIPDAIEPISAYRAWFFSIEGRTARLHPLSGPIQTSEAWEGAGSTWVTASCPRFGSTTHEVPSEGCSCGFYSLKELELAVAHTEMLHLMATHVATQGRRHGQVVLGRVLLSGKVIEHDLGYRAERARISELIPFRGTERSIMVLANRLGVGMAPAVDPGLREEVVRALVGSSGPPPTHARAPRKAPTQPPADALSGPVAGVLAIVVLIAASMLSLAGVWQPPIAVVFLSLLQLGRSADSLSQMFRDLRDWRGSGMNRPRFLPPVPPPAA
jgi:type IV secretory pathway VirB2 component (pilin)